MERDSLRYKRQFLEFAKGSCGELRTQIYIGIEIGYLAKETGLGWIQETREISAMLVGLMQSLPTDNC